ncbi:MAG: aldehyde dehydrogenase family protein, partial [Ketobacter sp.]
MNKSILIDQQWSDGNGAQWQSRDPVDNHPLWEGRAADSTQVDAAVASARAAFFSWSGLTLQQRLQYVNRFVAALQENAESLANLISRESGKALWDARTEVAAMSGKAAISLQAYGERSGSR